MRKDVQILIAKTADGRDVEIGLQRPGRELQLRADDVWDILAATDHDFIPPLSARDGTTTKALSLDTVWGGPVTYYDELMAQYVIFAEIAGRCVGLVSFIPNYEDELLPNWSPSTYTTTIAVHPGHRHKRIANALMSGVLALPEAEFKTEWMSTRTWSTNAASIALFTSFGFKEVARLKAHRRHNVDTVYMARPYKLAT